MGPLTAQDVEALAGETLELQAGSQLLRFHVSQAEPGQPGGPRAGLEAIGVQAEFEYNAKRLPAFLKLFKSYVPQRTPRSWFLLKLGLAKKHWMFEGLPFAFVPLSERNGVHLHGHASRLLVDNDSRSTDLKALMESDQWNFTEEQRGRLGGQLCCAILTLEGIGLVHGDLSLGNVLVGHHPRGGLVAMLCDYDGFEHPDHEPLPMEGTRDAARKLGSYGFQYPMLQADQAAGRPDIRVETDRFALGALVCQIKVWEPGLDDQLRRIELLTEEMIQQRSLASLPLEIRSRWRDGFELLQRALDASELAEMPGPRAWLAALGGPPLDPPILVVRNEKLVTLGDKTARLSSSAGDLGRLHPELAGIRFVRREDGARLDFDPSASVLVSRWGGVPDRTGSTVELGRRDRAFSGAWQFEIQ